MYPGFEDPQVRYKELALRVISEWLKDGEAIRDDGGELLLMFRVWCYAADLNADVLARKFDKANE